MGFDYRYDFRSGKGVGIESGLYLRYLARRYDHDIFGEYTHNTSYYGPIFIDDRIIDRTYLYTSATSLGFFIPVHLTYTHFFYRDWSITTFAGLSFDLEYPQRVMSYEQLLLTNGTTQKVSHGLGSMDLMLLPELGIGFSYRHFQFKAGASFIPGRINSGLRFDGSIPSADEMNSLNDRPSYSIANLYFTFGYRIK